MRIQAFLLATFSFISLSLAAAHASPEAGPDAAAFRRYCHLPGQHCDKLKRAADAAAEALAAAGPDAGPDAEPFRRFCHLNGQGCAKAKRSAEALAEAVAKANAVASPDPEADAEVFRRYCHLPGQYCGKVKRAAAAIADALAEPEPAADPKAEPFRRFCHMAGQGCAKAKRGAQDLTQAAEDAVANLSHTPPEASGPISKQDGQDDNQGAGDETNNDDTGTLDDSAFTNTPIDPSVAKEGPPHSSSTSVSSQKTFRRRIFQ